MPFVEVPTIPPSGVVRAEPRIRFNHPFINGDRNSFVVGPMFEAATKLSGAKAVL